MQLDSFKRLQDYPVSQAANVARYEELKKKTNLTPNEQSELSSLRVMLRPYLYEADDINLVSDSLEKTQKFVKNEIDGYITERQNETRQYVDNMKNEVQGIMNKFSYKNLYDITITYQKFNCVTYDGEGYISKHDDNLGNIPIGNVSDAHWGKISQRGVQGAPGIGLTFIGEYNNARSYNIQDAVNYNNNIYYCISPSTGNVPTNTSYWSLFLSGTGVTIANIAPVSPFLHQIWIDESS